MFRHVAPGAHVSVWISVGNKDTLMTLLCFKSPGSFSFTTLSSLSFLINAVHFNVTSHQEGKHKPATVAHAYNLNTQETEAGGLLQVLGQPGVHSRTLSQANKQNNNTTDNMIALSLEKVYLR